MHAYNIYVKRKEKELRELIEGLESNNSQNNFNERKINQLEVEIDSLKKQAFDDDIQKSELKRKIQGL